MIVKSFTKEHLQDAQQKRQDAQGAATSALLEVISGLVAQQQQPTPQVQAEPQGDALPPVTEPTGDTVTETVDTPKEPTAKEAKTSKAK